MGRMKSGDLEDIFYPQGKFSLSGISIYLETLTFLLGMDSIGKPTGKVSKIP